MNQLVDFGKNIKLLRNCYEIPQYKLASRLNIPVYMLSNIENGKVNFSLMLINKFAIFFQQAPYDLMFSHFNISDCEKKTNVNEMLLLDRVGIFKQLSAVLTWYNFSKMSKYIGDILNGKWSYMKLMKILDYLTERSLDIDNFHYIFMRNIPTVGFSEELNRRLKKIIIPELKTYSELRDFLIENNINADILYFNSYLNLENSRSSEDLATEQDLIDYISDNLRLSKFCDSMNISITSFVKTANPSSLLNLLSINQIF